MKENINTNSLSKEETVLKIGVIRDEVSIMGFNDSEIPQLNALMEGVASGTLDTTKALEEAEKIKSSKQDYH